VPARIAIGCGTVKVGGGTLPKSTMPSVTIDIVPKNCSLADFAARLRASNPAVIGYLANARFKLDLRTIFPQQDELVVAALRAACANTKHHEDREEREDGI
jgi:L-seryl-tRNA(Ser) seleniumtransferase